MYIDTIERRLLPTIPPFYRYSSGFDALSDIELAEFGIFPVRSYIEDDAHRDFIALLGSSYFQEVEFGFEFDVDNPGEGVRITFDREAAIDKLKAITGHSGDYASVADVLLGHEVPLEVTNTQPIPPVLVTVPVYLFVVLGTSDLVSLDTFTDIEAEGINRFEYALERTPLSAFPLISAGDEVTQEGGFTGVVEHVDAGQQVIKVGGIVGHVLQGGDLVIGGVRIPESSVFRFEVYSEATIDGEPLDLQGFATPLAELGLHIRYVYTTTFPEGTSIKIELGTMDCSIDRPYMLTEEGRLV